MAFQTFGTREGIYVAAVAYTLDLTNKFRAVPFCNSRVRITIDGKWAFRCTVSGVQFHALQNRISPPLYQNSIVGQHQKHFVSCSSSYRQNMTVKRHLSSHEVYIRYTPLRYRCGRNGARAFERARPRARTRVIEPQLETRYTTFFNSTELLSLKRLNRVGHLYLTYL